MKISKAQILGKFKSFFRVEFGAENLTSFAGLVIFGLLFSRLQLKERLRRCFAHLDGSPLYSRQVIILWLLVHLLLGFRRLRDIEYYRGDPLVLRTLGLKRLPDVATISRALKKMDEREVEKLADLSCEMVMDRLRAENFSRLTVDFDGSVLSTKGQYEGTAVGYNPRHKGARSYYPLFCTVAQTGQFLDMQHRPGNVHDSKLADDFIMRCLDLMRRNFPRAILEARLDGAHFSDNTLDLLTNYDAQFSVSAPFRRFWALKSLIDNCTTWRRIDKDWSCFEKQWKPESWDKKYRFIFYRQRVKQRDKAPLQLDLFTPASREYEYSVIVTNKQESAEAVLLFHHGRGAQEGIFGEAKSRTALDVIPTKRLHGNQTFTLCAMMAHNLGRELQMQISPPQRKQSPTRAALWCFKKLDTLRRELIQRAARFIRPQGKLTLLLPDHPAFKRDFSRCLEILKPAA